MKKKWFKRTLGLMMVATVLLTGCGGGSETTEGGDGASTSTTSASDNDFKSVETFAYGSLDPHVDYYSWHSQKYGLTETLYRINDDMELEPWLAESATTDESGQVTTVVLKDGVCFSNGTPLTSEMVKRNFERLIEKNNRFLYMADWTITPVDDKTFTIDTGAPYPTIVNDLATPELCMLDLDATTDFVSNPIATGPFKVETFVPEGDITLVRNDNYWGGEVICDSVTFYSMSDDQSKLMAMQNGEIDAYDNITSSDIELFSQDPDTYDLYSVPMQMRGYAFMNSERLPQSVREAITLMVDREAIASFMPGMFTATATIFDTDADYGVAQPPATDVDKARAVLEADGYVLTNGVYMKDGQPLKVTLACYASRNIDTIAVLLQEQLNAFGIQAEIALKEDPDGTYMTDRDYEIGFYRSITDKTGDPITFLEFAVQSSGYGNVAGFGNEETDALIQQYRYEMDEAKRNELANEIMQQYYDSYTILVLNCYNRNTVMRKGVTNFNENNPYEFYGVSAATTPAN